MHTNAILSLGRNFMACVRLRDKKEPYKTIWPTYMESNTLMDILHHGILPW